MLAFVVSRLQETRRRDTGESLERLSLLGASWGVGRSTRGAARNGQRRERHPARPNQCKSSSLCVSITTSEVGLAVPASEKGAALRRRGPPGRLEGQASRAACKADRALRKPAVRRPRRRCRRGAAASAGGYCTRASAGEHEARRLLVVLEEAAAAHVHRARHDLRRGRRRALAGLRVAGADEQAGVDDGGGGGARGRRERRDLAGARRARARAAGVRQLVRTLELLLGLGLRSGLGLGLGLGLGSGLG